MKKLNEKEAKVYSEEKFKILPKIYQKWNYLHSKYIISALEELAPDNKFDKDKLRALAWVHDIGKIEGEENHPEKGLNILSKDFDLDEIDKDCVLNHGSSSKPLTPEGRLFRNADGLSLFYPEIIKFKHDTEKKEGKSPEEISESINKMYETYKKAYADNPHAIKLLKDKYLAILRI